MIRVETLNQFGFLVTFTNGLIDIQVEDFNGEKVIIGKYPSPKNVNLIWETFYNVNPPTTDMEKTKYNEIINIINLARMADTKPVGLAWV